MTQITRSDESIKESVVKFLKEYPYVDASHIEVIVEYGFVNLQGTVRDRPQKIEAENAVKAIPGVKDVFNYLTINPRNGLIGNANTDLNMI